MVSTRSRAGVTKQPKAGPTARANVTPDLVAILEGQAKMQQEIADLRKHNVGEMEALRQENSRLEERSRLTLSRKGRPRNRQKPQSHQLTSLVRKKMSTTPLRTPSPPLSKHPSSLPITQTFIIDIAIVRRSNYHYFSNFSIAS